MVGDDFTPHHHEQLEGLARNSGEVVQVCILCVFSLDGVGFIETVETDVQRCF